MIKVLLVDDHAVVRAGYHRFLEDSEEIRVVAEAANAEQGYAAFCSAAPDVSVIDLSMPGVGGLQLIQRIVAREPAARLVAFSMHEDGLYAVKALQAGARGYITKNSAPDTLIEAIQQVHAGKVFLSPDIVQQLALNVTAPSLDLISTLSTKEFEIFRMIAQGASVAEIAVVLNLSQKTVANYQTVIKEKLGANTTAALVHVAARHGVIRIVTPEQDF